MNVFTRFLHLDPVGYLKSQNMHGFKNRGGKVTVPCPFCAKPKAVWMDSATGFWFTECCDQRGDDIHSFHAKFHRLRLDDAARELGVKAREQYFGPCIAVMDDDGRLDSVRREALFCALAACQASDGSAMPSVARTKLLSAIALLEGVVEEVSSHD